MDGCEAATSSSSAPAPLATCSRARRLPSPPARANVDDAASERSCPACRPTLTQPSPSPPSLASQTITPALLSSLPLTHPLANDGRDPADHHQVRPSSQLPPSLLAPAFASCFLAPRWS